MTCMFLVFGHEGRRTSIKELQLWLFVVNSAFPNKRPMGLDSGSLGNNVNNSTHIVMYDKQVHQIIPNEIKATRSRFPYLYLLVSTSNTFNSVFIHGHLVRVYGTF